MGEQGKNRTGKGCQEGTKGRPLSFFVTGVSYGPAEGGLCFLSIVVTTSEDEAMIEIAFICAAVAAVVIGSLLDQDLGRS